MIQLVREPSYNLLDIFFVLYTQPQHEVPQLQLPATPDPICRKLKKMLSYFIYIKLSFIYSSPLRSTTRHTTPTRRLDLRSPAWIIIITTIIQLPIPTITIPTIPLQIHIIIRHQVPTPIPRYASGRMSSASICIPHTTTATATIPMPHGTHPTGSRTMRMPIKITGAKSSSQM